MKRFGLMVAPLLVVMIVMVGVSGSSERFAIDRDAPWVVTDVERFVPPELEPVSIQSVSPRGAWLYGQDESHPHQPECFWNTSTWVRACPALAPGEAFGFNAFSFAWSPDETSFVVATHRQVGPAGQRRHVQRLLRIDPASGEVITLLRVEPGTWIREVAFSPDGNQIAFLELDGDTPRAIRRIDRDGDGLATIVTASATTPLAYNVGLHWTAAGQLVFFSGPVASDTQGYFRVGSDGSGLARISAVTPGEFETRILDVSADGRYMIAEGTDETEACGPDLDPPWYVVDLERDALAQVICDEYRLAMPDGRGANLLATTSARVTFSPAFLPDGSVLVWVRMDSGDSIARGLAMIDIASGRISTISNDMHRDDALWDVSAGRDDGSARVWIGGYWNEQLTLVPAGG